MSTKASAASSQKHPLRFHVRDYAPRIQMTATGARLWLPEFPLSVSVSLVHGAELIRGWQKLLFMLDEALVKYPPHESHPIPYDYVMLGMTGPLDARRSRLKVRDVAGLLSCSEQTVRRLMDSGKIPCERKRGDSGERTASLQAVLRFRYLNQAPLPDFDDSTRLSLGKDLPVPSSPRVRASDEAKRLGVSRTTYWRRKKAGKITKLNSKAVTSS